jgi:hypothetical protein
MIYPMNQTFFMVVGLYGISLTGLGTKIGFLNTFRLVGSRFGTQSGSFHPLHLIVPTVHKELRPDI